MMKNKLLILSLVIASALRLWSLNINPPHLYSDEASLGYNAYSILTTTRDEHGEFLPVVFKSFGDWKPGFYVYLTVPFVAVAGLSEWTVRLPSAIAGIIAVWLIYLVARNLFKEERVASLSALTLALVPWHIHFSRGAWEANVALTLLLAGVYCFLEFAKGNKNSLLFSAVFFGLTMWTYQGAKLSTSLVVLLLCVLYSKNLLKDKKVLFKTFALGLLIIVPIFLSFTQGKTGRLNVFSVFSYERPTESVNEILSQEGAGLSSWQYYLYHSETLSFAKGIAGRWLNHFSGEFLFFTGDENARHHATDVGMLLLVQLPLLLVGLANLLKVKNPKAILFIIGWLLLAPLPAALSRDEAHAVRSFNMVVPLVFLTAAGGRLLINITSSLTRTLLLTICLVGILLNYFYYLDQYYVHYPRHDSEAWMTGHKDAVAEIKKSPEYKNVIFQQSYNQPYIFYLFYEKFDPAKFQEISNSYFEDHQYGDVGKLSKLENISFRDATEGDLTSKSTMIIYNPETPPFPAIFNHPPDAQVIQIKRYDNSSAFTILKLK